MTVVRANLQSNVLEAPNLNFVAPLFANFSRNNCCGLLSSFVLSDLASGPLGKNGLLAQLNQQANSPLSSLHSALSAAPFFL